MELERTSSIAGKDAVAVHVVVTDEMCPPEFLHLLAEMSIHTIVASLEAKVQQVPA